MDLKLTNKLALVTGSTKGIGFAIAVGLAREGARVIVNGRTEKSVIDAQIKFTKPFRTPKCWKAMREICPTRPPPTSWSNGSQPWTFS